MVGVSSSTGPYGRASRQALFSAEQACAIAGVSADLLSNRFGKRFEAAAEFTLADILGLGVMGELLARADTDLEAFAVGFTYLFQALAASSDVERLDGVTAVLGPRSAELCSSEDVSVQRVPAGSVTVPLGPLLANLRDLVFA